MTESTSKQTIPDNDIWHNGEAYYHELFFGDDWTNALEERVERIETLLREIYPPTGDTMIVAEEGEPIKLMFWTKDEVGSKDRGRIILMTAPNNATFNIDAL